MARLKGSTERMVVLSYLIYPVPFPAKLNLFWGHREAVYKSQFGTFQLESSSAFLLFRLSTENETLK